MDVAGLQAQLTESRTKVEAFEQLSKMEETKEVSLLQNVFSYDRMCSLTIECVVLLEQDGRDERGL